MNDNLKQIARYNPWGNPDLYTGIARPHYTTQLLRYCNNRIIKVLTGQRRTGKSFILRQLAHELVKCGVDPANILIVNMEYAPFGFIKDGEDLRMLIETYKRELNVKGHYHLMVDEVQDIPGWERIINSYSQDPTEDADIFLTGSNSGMLSGELATKIAGRYVQFPVWTLSFEEFRRFGGLTDDRASYIRFIRSGGLPALSEFRDDDMRVNYVSSLRDTIMLKDIVSRYAIKDISLLDNLFAFMVTNVSNLVSIPNIVNYLKSNGASAAYLTVADYVSHLREAFLIHRVERCDVRGKGILSGPNKYYANDLAYKNYLYSYAHGGIGYLLENRVFLDLIRHGLNPLTGTIQGKEIDFIAEHDGRRLHIQVTHSLDDEATRNREVEPLMHILPAHDKWIVSLDDFSVSLPAGIRHIPAWRLDSALRGFLEN